MLKETLLFFFGCFVFCVLFYILTTIMEKFGIRNHWFTIVASLVIFTAGKLMIRRLIKNSQNKQVNESELS